MTDQERIADLERRVARLEGGEPRLGPQPVDEAEDLRRSLILKDLVTVAEVKITNKTLDTTDGRSVEDARASQTNETGQHPSYIVLSEAERQKGFLRPYRDSYRHTVCGTVTTMGRALSETYAVNPAFYTATFCCGCNKHLPVAEFVWTADGQVVGS